MPERKKRLMTRKEAEEVKEELAERVHEEAMASIMDFYGDGGEDE